jgi:H+/Cl- antiporter ClcA
MCWASHDEGKTSDMGLAGPAFLCCFVAFTVRGELPGKHGILLTADAPYLFYPVMLALILVGLKGTQLSLLLVRAYFRGRKARCIEKPDDTHRSA